MPGGDFNVGTYVNTQMTSLIKKTISGTSNLNAYGPSRPSNYPFLYQPQSNSIDEVTRNLKSSIGFAPNPLGDFMPSTFTIEAFARTAVAHSLDQDLDGTGTRERCDSAFFGPKRPCARTFDSGLIQITESALISRKQLQQYCRSFRPGCTQSASFLRIQCL